MDILLILLTVGVCLGVAMLGWFAKRRLMRMNAQDETLRPATRAEMRVVLLVAVGVVVAFVIMVAFPDNVLLQHIGRNPRLYFGPAMLLFVAGAIIYRMLRTSRLPESDKSPILAKDPNFVNEDRQRGWALLAGLGLMIAAEITRSYLLPSSTSWRLWGWALTIAALVAVASGISIATIRGTLIQRGFPDPKYEQQACMKSIQEKSDGDARGLMITFNRAAWLFHATLGVSVGVLGMSLLR